jgi:hypothetical protein
MVWDGVHSLTRHLDVQVLFKWSEETRKFAARAIPGRWTGVEKLKV